MYNLSIAVEFMYLLLFDLSANNSHAENIRNNYKWQKNNQLLPNTIGKAHQASCTSIKLKHK